mmetsp:Transcript_132606/g.296538  ORF Transcript_132606/g.296538 Transcript_132606/m.296538 type:complete len:715 (+) Transcript_132606:80-2224(+)
MPSISEPASPHAVPTGSPRAVPTLTETSSSRLGKRRGHGLARSKEVSQDKISIMAALQRVVVALQTGAFINRMWGEAGTALGATQMFFIRLTMIWPLKAVTPAAYSYLLWQLVRRLSGRAEVTTLRPPGLLPLLRSATIYSCRELLRFWLSMEAIFFLYYKFKHWQLQRRAASAPVLPPGKPMEALTRALDTVKMIQVGGKIAEPHLTFTRSLPILTLNASHTSPPLTPKASAQDLQFLLHSQERESGVEELLRDWHDMRSRKNAASPDIVPTAVMDTESQNAAFEQLADDAEVLALKQAEASGWFLKRKGRSERWPVSQVGEIRQDNIKEWVAWAFLHCELDQVPSSRSLEVDELTEEIIRWMEVPMQPGYNAEVTPMRLTMDPIPSAHRPLIYYVVTQTIFSQVINIQVRLLGFTEHWSGTLAYWHRPAPADNASPTGPSASSSRPVRGESFKDGGQLAPIVFCHGIGVNILPYRPFLNELLERYPERSFFIISLPHISMRIKEEVPSSTEMVATLSDMLASWGFDSAHFVGHSFGSLPLAWMARKAPHMVSMMTFIDPVCFLLIKPDVCYNFMYRTPADPTQLLINYFLAKELYIAHSLSRNFFWHQNVLWPDELHCPTLVVLSGRDSIVPAHSVRRYLTTYKQRCNLSSLRVLWFPDLGHGEINFGPVGEAACTRIVSEMMQLEFEQSRPKTVPAGPGSRGLDHDVTGSM